MWQREPYRLFFPLGAVWAAAGCLLWRLLPANTNGISDFYFSLLTGCFLVPLMLGFLVSAIPNFTSTKPVSRIELFLLVLTITAQGFCCLTGRPNGAVFFSAVLVIVFSFFAIVRFQRKESPSKLPTELIWIPAGLVFAGGGAVLSVIAKAGTGPGFLPGFARLLQTEGVWIAMFLGLGTFMIPRLMGTFRLVINLKDTPAKKAAQLRRRRLWLHLFAAAGLAFSFYLESLGISRTALTLRWLILSLELFWTGSLVLSAPIKDFFIFFLKISVWIVFGSYAYAVFNPFQSVSARLVFWILAGGLAVYTLATVIVLTHGGSGGKLRKPLWIFPVVFLGLIAGSILFPVRPFYGALLWSLTAGIWLFAVSPRLRSPASP